MRVWRHVLKWVKNGLGSSNRVNLDGFKDAKEMNDLLKTTKTHLRKIMKQKAVNTGIRNLSHASDDHVKGKSDKMFQAHRRSIAAEQPKFKMILGVTSLGKWKRQKKGAKNPEKVNGVDKDRWRDTLMDDVITASQQRQCWETHQKIVNQTTTEEKERKEVNLITVALSKATANKGETNTPAHEATNARSNVTGTHNHQMDDWNDHDWLRCDVSKLVGLSKLSSVVVKNKWNWESPSNSNESRKKKKGKNGHFKAKCSSSFSEDMLPGLLKHSLLSEDACTHFPMNVWFFTMLHVFQKRV